MFVCVYEKMQVFSVLFEWNCSVLDKWSKRFRYFSRSLTLQVQTDKCKSEQTSLDWTQVTVWDCTESHSVRVLSSVNFIEHLIQILSTYQLFCGQIYCCNWDFRFTFLRRKLISISSPFHSSAKRLWLCIQCIFEEHHLNNNSQTFCSPFSNVIKVQTWRRRCYAQSVTADLHDAVKYSKIPSLSRVILFSCED